MTTLDTDVLIADAQESTGFTDFGDDTLPVRVALVVDRLNSAQLDETGSRAAASTIDGLLTSRLRFIADHARLSLQAEAIAAPLFATGEPRSGTTLLHALLAEDEDSRALRFWEVMYPSPPPGPAGVDDPRRAQADADWREILDRIPPWIVSHPYNDLLGAGLPECERTWAFDFRATNPSAWWRVPLTIQNFGQDHRAQYALHRMMLQHIQHSRPPKRWVLKGFHGRRLRALFDTYPDARIVWVHRDPVQVLASQIVAFGQINESLAGALDWTQYAKDTIEGSRANFHAYLTDPLVDDPRIHHVRYRDFVADPVAAIGGFYDFAGLPLTDAAEKAMRDYLVTNRSDRYGKFTYSTDVLPVPVQQLHDEFAGYRERFGIDIETRH
ncbi:sulfotransferase [Mycolicibacterium conceptionense]|uniref:Sulfotransferase n=1 Tax=Mycolicibacterium conceptionense TaxID=451644 RepID=A0A1A1X212_9MYCO|nr:MULTISPECIES: sulfotransferase [Mycolicibacterium]MCW1819646.1 sulfotransferase [Mycolicibacterium senegalense]OBB12502.1 sulfotransferase [Mycolicibacterium conceptionense]OBF08781.1 sulfotransferase [Mycolicibacterium conceptionense]OBF12766.1 sulfotransferase [Mycolicibacterium conceptionense]OBF45282.1 sulfotransferase [Mycolicibacterium conceptionense]